MKAKGEENPLLGLQEEGKMKESLGDKVVDRLHERRWLVRQKLRETYKKTKPFREEPISNNELLFYYNDLDASDIDYLVQTHGRDKVNTLIAEMETLKQRRQK